MVVGAYIEHKKQTKSGTYQYEYKYEWIFAIQNDFAIEYENIINVQSVQYTSERAEQLKI